MNTRRIAARGIVQRYPSGGRDGDGLLALSGVDIHVADGEFVSVVGPSGCGKSTLLDILTGLMSPTEGEVIVDGDGTANRLGRVGYMPQQDLLMPWRTLLDNAILGLETAGVRRAEARRLARAEMARFGLDGFEQAYPDSLSGGMRQRAALLRTFLAGREVMLLDEPFGALDALTRLEMQEWLLEVWSTNRKSIIFVTHDVEEAVFLSDRVYAMSPRPGRISLEVEIDLPRPRSREATTDPLFVRLKQRLLSQLRDSGSSPTSGGLNGNQH